MVMGIVATDETGGGGPSAAPSRPAVHMVGRLGGGGILPTPSPIFTAKGGQTRSLAVKPPDSA